MHTWLSIVLRAVGAAWPTRDAARPKPSTAPWGTGDAGLPGFESGVIWQAPIGWMAKQSRRWQTWTVPGSHQVHQVDGIVVRQFGVDEGAGPSRSAGDLRASVLQPLQ